MSPRCSLRRIGPLAASLLLAGAIDALHGAGACDPEPAVTRTFEGFVRARNARDTDTVMSFFAKDALLSYPGSPDAGFDALREIFGKSYSNPDLEGRYSVDVQEVRVSDDLAFVRVVWTGELRQKSTGRQVHTRDKDLEIWRCQPDGSWKLFRGMSFPAQEPPKPGL